MSLDYRYTTVRTDTNRLISGRYDRHDLPIFAGLLLSFPNSISICLIFDVMEVPARKPDIEQVVQEASERTGIGRARPMESR